MNVKERDRDIFGREKKVVIVVKSKGHMKSQSLSITY